MREYVIGPYGVRRAGNEGAAVSGDADAPFCPLRGGSEIGQDDAPAVILCCRRRPWEDSRK